MNQVANSLLRLNDNIRDQLNDYRKEKKLTDVELEVSGKLFPAHRLVLSLGSPVFGAAFSETWTQSKIYPLSDEHVDVEIMEDLLNFLYTGSIHFTPEKAHSICMAAHFLQIRKLLEPCVNYLCDQINIENVLSLFVFSTSHNLNVLRNSCLKFIFTDYEKVFHNPQILQFSSNDFTDLIVELKNKCFGTRVREQTFECVVRWAETDLPERLNELPVLLENIPLEEVSYRFLTQTVFKHSLVKESFPCIQSILKTFKLSSFEAVLDSELIRSNQNLIVIGRRKSGDVFTSVMNYYHAQSQTWRKLPDMLQRRRHFAVAVMNHRDIIVSGGIVGQITGSVEMFSWNTHTWQKLPDMPANAYMHSMAVHDGHLYVAGGLINALMSKILQYSFKTRDSKYLKDMTNTQRLNQHSHCNLVSYRGHLHAIGSVLKSVERYDPARDEWTMLTSMGDIPDVYYRETAKYQSIVVHQEKMYISGVGLFEVYDSEANTWTSLPVPTYAASTSLVSLNGKLLAVAEWEVGGCIYEFDFPTQQWKIFDDIPSNLFPRHAIVGH